MRFYLKTSCLFLGCATCSGLHLTRWRSTLSNLYYTIQIFGKKYPSCRGAKVYRNSDGSSRCIGFIRFCDQKDQELALIEMNHIKVAILFLFFSSLCKQRHFQIRGQDIQLKLAPLKQRLPRFQINQKSNYSVVVFICETVEEKRTIHIVNLNLRF